MPASPCELLSPARIDAELSEFVKVSGCGISRTHTLRKKPPMAIPPPPPLKYWWVGSSRMSTYLVCLCVCVCVCMCVFVRACDMCWRVIWHWISATWLRCQWVMESLWMSHVAHSHETCHTCERWHVSTYVWHVCDICVIYVWYICGIGVM